MLLSALPWQTYGSLSAGEFQLIRQMLLIFFQDLHIRVSVQTAESTLPLLSQGDRVHVFREERLGFCPVSNILGVWLYDDKLSDKKISAVWK